MTTTLPRQAAAPTRGGAGFCVWAGIFLGVFIVAPGCNGPLGGAGVRGSGVVKTEKRVAAKFARIEISGFGGVTWQPGKETSLEVTADDNLLPLLVTEVDGDTLRIHFKERVSATREIVVKTAGPTLDGFRGSGATQGTLDDVSSDTFKLALSGASRCKMSGKANKLTAEVDGASALLAGKLKAQSAQVNVRGASSVEVDVAESITGEAAGASRVHIHGNPAVQEVKTSGASSVRKN